MLVNTQNAVPPNYSVAQTSAAAGAEKVAETNRTGNDYLQDLKDRYPKANISVGDVGGVGGVEGYAWRNNGDLNNVAIHPDALDKFAKDPAAAAKFEETLKWFLDSEDANKAYADSQDMVLTGRGLYVREDGSMGAWAIGYNKASGKSAGEISIEKQKEALKEADKKHAEKKAEEKREAKRAEMEERMGIAPKKHFFVDGSSMDDIMRRLSALPTDGMMDIRA
jgi:hypothetical protein